MENTAKNFALQLGSLISLYVSATALVTLLFGLITLSFPDVANGYWEHESATSSVRLSIALLVIFFPTYLILTRVVNRIRRSEQGVYLTLTKWLVYLSLLIGGAIILGDLVSVVHAFLNGELTIRFLLKALSLFVVVGGAFIYYFFDARGYWNTHEKCSIQYAAVTLCLVSVAVIFGFLSIETPTVVREMKIDAQQISDLEVIQSHIESYYYLHSTLPQDLNVAFEALPIPQIHERAPYVYTVTDGKTYELCATFAYASTEATMRSGMMYAEPLGMKGVISWEHGVGEWCFKRIVPDLQVVPS